MTVLHELLLQQGIFPTDTPRGNIHLLPNEQRDLFILLLSTDNLWLSLISPGCWPQKLSKKLCNHRGQQYAQSGPLIMIQKKTFDHKLVVVPVINNFSFFAINVASSFRFYCLYNFINNPRTRLHNFLSLI